jgi:hypothetical protein
MLNRRWIVSKPFVLVHFLRPQTEIRVHITIHRLLIREKRIEIPQIFLPINPRPEGWLYLSRHQCCPVDSFKERMGLHYFRIAQTF